MRREGEGRSETADRSRDEKRVKQWGRRTDKQREGNKEGGMEEQGGRREEE